MNQEPQLPLALSSVPTTTPSLEASTSNSSLDAVAPSTSSAPAASSSSTERRKQPAAPPAPTLPRHLIREGDNVLLRLPSTVVKAIKLNSTAIISLGKYGTFKGSELVGLPYGPTYEIIEGGKLQVLQHKTLNEIEETEANNQEIASVGTQKLTFEDINSLKNEGFSGREIIQKQIEEHGSFDKKTEYSKDKYMKRKEAKYLQIFTPIEPTVHNICEYNFEKLSSKIRELRPDTLSYIMNSANVRPGARLLVVDDVHGMVVAACVERMGGEGRIMVLNAVDSPPDLHLLESFNFSPSALEPIESLHWGMTERSWTPADLPLEVSAETLAKTKNSRDIAKIRKRRAAYDKVQEVREEYFRGGFDGVILATEFEPYSVLSRLLPYIGGSAPIVVYSPFLTILFDAYLRLRSDPCFLAPTISEPWLRKYQVLPGRTHPEMQGMGHGGYLMTTHRVYENQEANSHKAKRRKVTSGGAEPAEQAMPAPATMEGTQET